MPGDNSRSSSAKSAQRGRTFFLSGYYGQGNLGDDLLLQATIEGISRITPVRSFIVRNEGDIAGLTGLPVPVELTGVDRIAADQTKTKLRRLVSTLAAYRRYFRRCDWLIFGGGTVFHERTSSLPIAMTFLVCLLARTMGMRIAALGVGVASIRSRAGKFLLKRIVGLSDVFAVRDDEALTECAKAHADSRVVLTSDLVFTMKKQIRAAGKATSSLKMPTVGISIYPPALRHSCVDDSTSSILRNVIEAILLRGWGVVLMTFHHQPGGTNIGLDADHLLRLADGLTAGRPGQIKHVVLNAANMSDLSDVFSEISVHCGMRFHGHVLSAIFGKPFVGISADNKIDAICHLFEMPIVQLNELSAERIIGAIDRALETRFDQTTLTGCKERAEKNFALLAGNLAVSSPVSP